MTYKKEDVVKVCEALIKNAIVDDSWCDISHYYCEHCDDGGEELASIKHYTDCPVLISQKILKECEG